MTNQKRTVEQKVGQRVKERREHLKLTQEELGRRLGDYLVKPWPRQAVYEAEKGMRQFRAVELVAIGEVLGLSPGSLISSPGEPIELPSGKTLEAVAALSLDDIEQALNHWVSLLTRLDEVAGHIAEGLSLAHKGLVGMREAIQIELGPTGEGKE